MAFVVPGITIKDLLEVLKDESNTTSSLFIDQEGSTNTFTKLRFIQTGNITIDFPTSNTTIVGTTDQQDLTNKNLVDTSTFIVDNSDNTIRIGFNTTGSTNTTTTLTSSQTANRTLTLPDTTDTMIARTTTDILTNKTIVDASNNTATDALKANAGNILVRVVDSEEPSSGQMLIATNNTTASWQEITASNEGVGGVGVFIQKTGNNFEFKNINSLNNLLSVIDDTTNNEIDLLINQQNIDHGNLVGLSDDDHLQYLLLNGRSGGQIATGGTGSNNNLILRSTSDSNKGSILIDETTDSTSSSTGSLVISGGVGISGNTWIENNLIVGPQTGINTNNPLATLDVNGNVHIDALLTANANIHVTGETKGDLLASDGTKFNLLQIGDNNKILKANSTTTTGIEWGELIFGQGYEANVNTVISITTSTTFQTKMQWITGAKTPGYYIYNWSYSWNHDATSNDFEARILIDSVEEMFHKQEPKDSSGTFDLTGTSQQYKASGSIILNHTTPQTHNVTVQWRTDNGGVESSMWDLRIEMYRIPSNINF